MKKEFRFTTADFRSVTLFTLFFLFFIQDLTVLFESVYRFNLLDTEFGPATAGLIAFAAPVYLFFIRRARDKKVYYMLWMFLLIRCLIPWVSNPFLIAVAATGVAFFLNAFILMISCASDRDTIPLASGMAMAVLLSTGLRAFGSSLDISISGVTAVIGYILIALAGLLLRDLKARSTSRVHRTGHKPVFRSHLYADMAGIFSVLGLILLFMASPGIIARWTGAGYLTLHIILTVSLTTVILLLNTPAFLNSLKPWHLLGWNGLFGIMLLVCIFLQTIDPPTTPAASPLVVYSSSFFQDLITYIMLLLAPVLFVDIAVFIRKISGMPPGILAGPALISSLLLLLAVCGLIFSAVWGYIGPAGPVFRQRFYLPFLLLLSGVLTPLILTGAPFLPNSGTGTLRLRLTSAGMIISGLAVTGIVATTANPAAVKIDEIKSLTVMTYNIQQGTDHQGNQSIAEQLSVIRQIGPDILCLQESDAARISGGNNDIVRYLTDNLDYYSYYGPKTVTGTFGTAVISRFPLVGCHVIFTFSDRDEIGTTVCTVMIKGDSVLLVNNHPEGGDAARQSHVNMLTGLIQNYSRLMVIGDFNFTQKSEYYEQITTHLNDSWLMVNPDGVGAVESGIPLQKLSYNKVSNGIRLAANRLDMSGRIDHIFLSENYNVTEAFYRPAPASASDHPAYRIVIEDKK